MKITRIGHEAGGDAREFSRRRGGLRFAHDQKLQRASGENLRRFLRKWTDHVLESFETQIKS